MSTTDARGRPVSPEHVAAVRRFTRNYTRRMGVLHQRLLGTPFSVTEARVLFDIEGRTSATASEIVDELGLDPAYLSRILRRLEARDLITRSPDADDRRRTILEITEDGRTELADLNMRADADVESHLAPLSEGRRGTLVRALREAEDLLGSATASPPIVALRDPEPGDFGWIIHRHGAHYPAEFGWDHTFEHVVIEIVAGYIAKATAGRDRCWIADVDGRKAGCVFLEHHTDEVAKLRLLFVEPWARGLGLGGRLVDACVDAARAARHARLTLWTMSSLASARRLYESRGFMQTDAKPVQQFGQALHSLTYTLDLTVDGPDHQRA